VQVVCDVLSQGDQLVGDDDVAACHLAQLEDTLAQAVVGVLVVGLGPDQGGGLGARHGAVERQQPEQRRSALFERLRRAIGQGHLRRTEQAQLQRRRSFVGRRFRHRLDRQAHEQPRAVDHPRVPKPSRLDRSHEAFHNALGLSRTAVIGLLSGFLICDLPQPPG
jgi:hypothetical protein